MKSNNKKWNLIISCVVLFMASSYVHGQSYHLSMLVNKSWVQHIPEKTFYMVYSYTDKEQIINMVIDGKLFDGIKSFYYLSEVIVDKFDPDFVGNNKSGKYIVALHKPEIGEDFLDISEILELTDITLKLKYLRSGTVLEYFVEANESQ